MVCLTNSYKSIFLYCFSILLVKLGLRLVFGVCIFPIFTLLVFQLTYYIHQGFVSRSNIFFRTYIYQKRLSFGI